MSGEPSALRRRPAILCVDDDEDGRDLCVACLAAAGYAVMEARDGRAALDMARRHVPDLILLDLRLPYLDGWEVAVQLKADATTRGIVIVALSASVWPEDRARALRVGCLGFIEKPADTSTLLATVRRALKTQNVPSPVPFRVS